MSDLTNTVTDPVATTPVSVSWEQEIWSTLEDWEKNAITDLHDAGMIFSADVWPAVKAAIVTLLSQLGQAAVKAVMATITDPVALPGAVGAAIVATASVDAPADALNAVTAAQAAIAADPTVSSLTKS